MKIVEISRKNYNPQLGEYVLELKKKFYIPDVEVILQAGRSITSDDVDIVNKFLEDNFKIKRKFDIMSILKNIRFKEQVYISLSNDNLMTINWGVTVKKRDCGASYITIFIGGEVKFNNGELHPYHDSIVIYNPYSFYSPLSRIPLYEKHIKFFTDIINCYPSQIGKDYFETMRRITRAFIDNMLFSALMVHQEKGVIEVQLFDGKKLYHSNVYSEEDFESNVEKDLMKILNDVQIL